MTYNKKETLKRLAHPYRYTKRKPRTREMRYLQGVINRINKVSCRTEDFIQNKYHFAQKIKHAVKVPETYIYTGYPYKVGNWLKSKTDITDFVIKPNHLSRGIGIRILTRIKDGKFQDTNGDILTVEDIVDECEALVKLKRYKGKPSIIIQERIQSHPDFNCEGMADIRMIYYDHRFLFSCIRIPNKDSGLYGNIHRGADFGFSIDGNYIRTDNRFLPATITNGKVPFFDEMILAGQKVTQEFGLRFLAVDMTINVDGIPVIVEAERAPQIHYYLTATGARWLLTELRIKGSIPAQPTPQNKKKNFGIPSLYFKG